MSMKSNRWSCFCPGTKGWRARRHEVFSNPMLLTPQIYKTLWATGFQHLLQWDFAENGLKKKKKSSSRSLEFRFSCHFLCTFSMSFLQSSSLFNSSLCILIYKTTQISPSTQSQTFYCWKKAFIDMINATKSHRQTEPSVSNELLVESISK